MRKRECNFALRTNNNEIAMKRCIVFVLLMLGVAICRAQGVLGNGVGKEMLAEKAFVSVPEARKTKVEVMYEQGSQERVSRYRKLELTVVDAYTEEETKVESSRDGNNAFSLMFNLRLPLYDSIKENGRLIPFYVEPGDYLIINVKEDGTIKYKLADGNECKWNKLLKHDVSNETYYDEKMFEADSRDASLLEFINKVVNRMDSSVARVAKVANEEKFSVEEKNVAISNVKMQFALWMMEYASWKTLLIARQANKQQAGWQSRPENEADIEALENVRNYSFLRRLPINDESCVASRFFPLFVQSYQHSHVLNHDQYLYLGDKDSDHVKMDSAMIAREKAITGMNRGSVFMDVIMAKRQMARDEESKRMLIAKKESAIDTTNSIKLNEVEVWSTNGMANAMKFSDDELLIMKLKRAPTGFNILGPIFWALNKYVITPWKKKHPSAKEKAKMRVQQYGEVDDALREAYEKMQNDDKGKK